ncbi:MAG: hypothetical protein VX871_12870 [Pseudomonadota bacterium]|nr:hypothetical protein [Pseudomonadota bacterium]
MADQVNTGGGAGMGMIVGALVVAVLVLGYFVIGGKLPGGGGKDVNVKIEAPAVSGSGGSGGSTN